MNFVFVNTQFLFFFSPTMFSGRGGLEERIIFSFTRLSLMTVVLPVVGASVVAPAVGLENGGGEKEREGRERKSRCYQKWIVLTSSAVVLTSCRVCAPSLPTALAVDLPLYNNLKRGIVYVCVCVCVCV